jgi:DNA-binding HxlR family transcriptional regulator
MKAEGSYHQFCPVAMAAEIFCTRWTPLVLRELLCGSTRFGDLRRGVPRMSPTLLSKRLKELADAGVISIGRGQGGVPEYRLTEAGEEMRGLVMALGTWGQRWVETSSMLERLDPTVLMWDMRRHLDTTPMPPARSTVEFVYTDLPAGKERYWLVVEAAREVEICTTDPGYEVDLVVETTLRTMTAIWMGMATLRAETEAGRVSVEGAPGLARSMDRWLGLSPFAKERSRRAAA